MITRIAPQRGSSDEGPQHEGTNRKYLGIIIKYLSGAVDYFSSILAILSAISKAAINHEKSIIIISGHLLSIVVAEHVYRV